MDRLATTFGFFWALEGRVLVGQGVVRLRGLDGLRGMAATWVVLFHIWGAIQRRDVDWVPSIVQGFLEKGFLGVDIFFVLSGFVIQYSMHGKSVDGFYIPRFILRRSIRIDPPYWATIALALAFISAKNLFFPEHGEPIPSFQEILVHMFYLQDLLGYPPISSVFWTLCLEFQFYLGFAVVTQLLYFATHGAQQRRVSPVLLFIASCTVVLSVYLRFSDASVIIPGTIIPYLWEFILGILACQYILGRLTFFELMGVNFLVLFTCLKFADPVQAVVPIATTVAIVGSARVGGSGILESRPLQFLGRISYSLYLTHAIVGWVSVSVLIQLTSRIDSPVVTFVIFLIGVAVSIIFGLIFYWILERRFIRLSKKWSAG